MDDLKDYQSGALQAFVRWRDALEDAARGAQEQVAALEKAGAGVPDQIRNYPRAAWAALARSGGVARSDRDYVDRFDDAGRPIPHVCLKVPTGGGKTLLAAAALERLGPMTGLVLWIVPTRAIYEQTRATLRNRQHVYRQMLERASGMRIKLLEKDDRFGALDVRNHLCAMLLMLPAANRQKGRNFLRMFRDSGRYPTLFPDDDDVLADARLSNDYPDLERVSRGGPVKRSLFNVFKMLRPIVILDEAHKAYGRKREAGEEFARSVSRLDPRMVIELSATPNPGISNLLVDVTGVELKAEEMIKLPVQVASYKRVDWRFVLAQVHDELDRLDAEAQALQKDTDRYVRPLAVVRVERTGRDQRDGARVHAEDVRDYLVRTLRVRAEAVAVKSAERDELAGIDLLSRYSPVRWIVTKAALAEGWDCPFAYVLAMLDNTTAQRALTQLVGRVMRQPHARRTGRQALDQCYVYCWNADVGQAVEQVKRGLEAEGLTGLGGEVVSGSAETGRVAVERREPFRGKDIFLPLVLHWQEDEGWRELDYARHIQPALDWESIGAPDPRGSRIEESVLQSAAVDLGGAPPVFHARQELEIDRTLRLSWFVRRLSDLVPNSWQAARIARLLLDNLRAAGLDGADVHDRRSYLTWELRKHVANEIDVRAKRAFLEKLGRKEVRFDLKAGRPSFRMVERYDLTVPEDAGLLARNDGRPAQLSLFEPVYASQFDSGLERSFARYLDEQKALHWWHRVAMRQGNDYYLKGWKPDRIWPDFIALGGGSADRPCLFLFETKGRHLDNPDSAYKRRVLDTLEGAFDCGAMTVEHGPAKGFFRLLFDKDEFPAALAGLDDAG